MEKPIKIIATVLIILIIITMCISLENRMTYGTWNVFSYPNKVIYGGVRYDKGLVVTFTDDEKPKYEVSNKIDKFTGKRIYSKTKDYIGPAKDVFLYLGGNKYLAYGSGGGP